MVVRKIAQQEETVKRGRGRPKGSKNKSKTVDIPVYAYRCKKCNHRFEINIRAFYHTCPKCQGQTDCTTTKGILK